MRRRKEMLKNARLVLGGQGIQHLEDLRLLSAGIHLAVVPVDRLPRLAGCPRQGKGEHTMGRRSLSTFSLTSLSASEEVLAPSTMDEMPLSPA